MNKIMRVSEIVAEVLKRNDVNLVFAVSGGASLHLISSIESSGIQVLYPMHEQAAAMGADAFSRIQKKLGVAIATSGPGATNLITGIAGAYYDSVPALFITGQVSTNRSSKGLGVRQLGFQETPIANMVREITKGAFEITDPQATQSVMQDAIALALDGRQGPVLVDIPDDIQRTQVNWDEDSSESFSNRKREFKVSESIELAIRDLGTLIKNSSQPLLVLGWGVHLSDREQAILDFCDNAEIPTLLTWAANDLIPSDRKYRIGTFGTHGMRSSNQIAQQADLIISLGSRLDSKATGSPPKSFAPNAKIVMVDVDLFEISKFSNLDRPIDLAIEIDFRAPEFVKLLKTIEDKFDHVEPWKMRVASFIENFPLEFHPKSDDFVNPYDFMKLLSKLTPTRANVVVDTGCAIAWTMQVWSLKQGQRIFHDFNNTAMGWSLPAAIASEISTRLSKEESTMTLCIVGDGSLSMTLQELNTISHACRSVKIVLLNNNGYAMIRQTQDQWFNSKYFASSAGRDFNSIDYLSLSKSFGLDYFTIEGDSEAEKILCEFFDTDNNAICEVKIFPDIGVIPQVKFGSTIENMDPNMEEIPNL